MVRGGEREAGLRARIEALLATLEKLGRCDLLHVLPVIDYILLNWTMDIQLRHLVTFQHLFGRNSELRQQQSGDLIDDLKRANG